MFDLRDQAMQIVRKNHDRALRKASNVARAA
jgi:hypothetical protein